MHTFVYIHDWSLPVGTQLGGTDETETLLNGIKRDQSQNKEIYTMEREEFPSNVEESEKSSVDTENSTLLKVETVSNEETTQSKLFLF